MLHRPIHREPVPIKPTHLIKLLDSRLPQLEEDARFHPLLKSIMGRRMRTEFGLVERLPLAACSQDVKARVRAASIRDAWASAAKAMDIGIDRKPRLQNRLQLIADPISCRRAVIRHPLPYSFLEFFFAYTPSGIR